MPSRPATRTPPEGARSRQLNTLGQPFRYAQIEVYLGAEGCRSVPAAQDGVDAFLSMKSGSDIRNCSAFHLWYISPFCVSHRGSHTV